MAKRSSLFGAPAAPKAAEEPAVPTAVAPTVPAADPNRKYPIAKTREGKRVATVYLEREALRQLQKIAFDEETTMQALLVEGINAVFQARGLSRIA
jgi:hypothetical protein